MATLGSEAIESPPQVPGLPFIGNVLRMAQDPARFFVDSYRRFGPVYRVRIFGNSYTVLAGVEAADFMGTRRGRDSLRSKEFWSGLVDEWGARRVLTGEDGETHQKLRSVLRHGYSKEAVQGRYGELVELTDRLLERDWPTGRSVPVLTSIQ